MLQTRTRSGNYFNCLSCGKEFYSAVWETKRGKKFCSQKCYQKEWSKMVPVWNKGLKGIHLNPKTEFKKGQTSGEKNINWKGGITSDLPRFTDEYKSWRTAVFERDNYTCVWCHQRGGRLNADHIYPQSIFPEKRYDLDNGRTLCIGCHMKTFTYLNPYLERKHFSGITGVLP
jgi:hypothetical protein